MHKTSLIPLVAGAVLLFSPLAEATHYKLFVLTGQSNSLGVTNGGEADPSIGVDAADAGVIFAWHNVVNATTSLGDSGGGFTTLQEQQGGFYTGSATHWGPEIDFARSLYRAGVRDFGVIKASRGGGGNTYWSKSAGGHMYSHVVNTVNTATGTLAGGGHTFEIVGLLYLQGESDSSGEAGAAGTRFKTLVDNLRVDLVGASSMHAVIGGIAAAGGNRDTVRANQAAIAASTAYIDYFETLDQQPNLHDSLHYNKAAKLTVGQRYAQEFFSAGLVSRHYGNLVFIGDSITQGGNGNPSYRYQVFKNLANAGVPINPAAGYKFSGSVSGAYQLNSGSTPNVNGQAFENHHDGHWGWRAFWENGRVALPSSRRSNNRGEGTILNWTGQASPQEYDLNTLGNKVSYPDPGASGTGNTGTTYTPDTAVIMIGINDLAGGSPVTQVRDDIGMMIDQLQAANPNIGVHMSEVLYTDQGASFQTTVDSCNDLLPALAAAKTTATSPVWVIETNSGFDPVTQTYDNVHPNAGGEEYVGDRISGGMAIIEMPEPASSGASTPPVIEKGTGSLTTCFDGNEIYNGTNYINGWTEVTPAATTESLNGTNLNRNHINGAGEWLEGIGSTDDGGITTWNTGNDGDWTFEARLKFNANPAGYAIWLGTDTKRIIVEIYGDRTQDNGDNVFNSFSPTDPENNLDGSFHTWRIVHDSGNQNYHVWRDGERLTPTDGAGYDGSGADSRVVMGDRTGGAFGNNYNVDIEYICYDQTGAYLPTGADADSDGMPDSWEYLYFGDITVAEPGDDDDDDRRTNLEEYIADTNPLDRASLFRIDRITETGPWTWDIVVPDSSPQRYYTLFASDDLGVSGPWFAVAGQASIVGTDGELVLENNSSGASRRFYRVGVSVDP